MNSCNWYHIHILILSLGIHVMVGQDYTIKPSKRNNYRKDVVVQKVDLHVPTDDNASCVRHGLLSMPQGAKATLILLHGFTSHRHDSLFIGSIVFPEYNTLVFDFRAHGECVDDAQCCTFGHEEINDAKVAAEFVRNHPQLKDLPCLCYGFSMGAVTAIEAQAKFKLFDALILDCPFDSGENIIKRALANLTFRFCGYDIPVPGRSYLESAAFHPWMQPLIKRLMRFVSPMDATPVNTKFFRVAPVESIKNVDVPCYFVHCKKDDKVPVHAVTSVYNGAQGFKRLWLTNGLTHFGSMTYNIGKYRHKLCKFIREFLDGKLDAKPREKIIEDLPL